MAAVAKGTIPIPPQGPIALIAARTLANARRYCQASGALYLLLTVLGFFLPTTLGFIPIGGNDIALHAVLGLALTLVGFLAVDDEPAPTRI